MDYTQNINKPNKLCGSTKEGKALRFRNPKLLIGLAVFVALSIVFCIFVFSVKRFKSNLNSATAAVVVADQDQAQIQTSGQAQAPGPAVLQSGAQGNQTAATPDSNIKNITITVRSKDSLQKIFKRQGLDVKDATKILSLRQAQSLKKIRPKQKIDFVLRTVDAKVKLEKLTYVIDDLNTLSVVTAHGGFTAELKHVEPVSHLRYASLQINGSIYSAANKAGVPRKYATQLMNIFSSKVSSKKIRSGDRFALFYKEYTVGGKKIKDGEIAAAELVHNNQIYRLIGFTDPSGATNYYTPEGYGIIPPFVRYPVSGARISSRFSLARFHPILGIVCAHLGVDFSARPGTPIRATSNGTVAFAGNKGNYGRAVIIQHGIYSTLYAHMLRIASNTQIGGHVKQGEVIGYVGSSGLATGPHLHYEFRVNGVHYDPLRVKLPAGEMIASAYKKRFFAFSKQMLAQLDLHRRDHRMLAMGGEVILK